MSWCSAEEDGAGGNKERRTEKYMGKENSNTVLLVVVLVMGVALIFICFALVAICYRFPSQLFCQRMCQCLCGSGIWMQNVEPPLIFYSKSLRAQNQGFSEKNPNCRDPMPLSVPRLKILRLCWQHTSAHHCDQILLIKLSCVLNNEQSLMLRVVAILCVLSSVLFSS